MISAGVKNVSPCGTQVACLINGCLLTYSKRTSAAFFFFFLFSALLILLSSSFAATKNLETSLVAEHRNPTGLLFENRRVRAVSFDLPLSLTHVRLETTNAVWERGGDLNQPSSINQLTALSLSPILFSCWLFSLCFCCTFLSRPPSL